MNHMGTKTIESERLLLRRFHLDDAHAMHQRWAGDYQLNAHMSWRTHDTVRESERVIKNWQVKYAKRKFYHWCVEVKATHAVIGEIYVRRLHKKVDGVELEFCINDAYQLDSLTAEACRIVIHFLFNQVQVKRIECNMPTSDVDKQRFVEALGFQHEGRKRFGVKTNHGLDDLELYSLLRGEQMQ